MTNLLEETLKVLADNGKTPDDVEWVGSVSFGWFSWDDFAGLANKTYNSGFGGQEVASDLVVAGKNWWLERHDYDGSEWWEYKEQPQRPNEHRIPQHVVRGSSLWETLEEMQGKKWDDED